MAAQQPFGEAAPGVVFIALALSKISGYGTVDLMAPFTGDGSIVIVASAREIAIDADADANLVGWEQGTPEVRDAGTLNATTPIS